MTDNPTPLDQPEKPMPVAQPRSFRRNRFVGFLMLVLVVGVGVAVFVVFVLPRFRGEAKPTNSTADETKFVAVELVKGKPDTIFIPADVRKALGIEGTFEIERSGKVVRDPDSRKSHGAEGTYRVEYPREGKPLIMPGSTELDPTRIRRVRSRFNADIIEIAKVKVHDPKSDREIERDIRPGDRVKEKQQLAVLWSLEVGMRKSDLADAIVQYRLDQQRLKDRTDLWKNGNLPLDLLNQTRRDLITDENNVARAERNLEVWKVPDTEIKAVREEAEAAFLRNGVRDKNKEKLWARSVLIAPIAGTIIESNIGGVGEFLPDSTVNLFTIADVSRLQVLGYPPEDQLPELLAIKPGQLRWIVKTVGVDPVDAPVEDISYILDPNQHTAVVKGYIDNPQRLLRGGQFATCSVKMSAPEGMVEIPLTALAEDGRMSFVFVQAAPDKYEYTMRRVQVVSRFEETAYVRSELTPQMKKLNEDEQKLSLPPLQPLVPNEIVLAAGVLELRAALDDIASKSKPEK